MNYLYKVVRDVINDFPGTKVTGPNDTARYLYTNCYDSATMYRENCWALFLDGQHNIIGQLEVSQGCTDACCVNIRLVVFTALQVFAKAVILSHNHPSGSCLPSARDLTVTGDLKKALSLFDIALLDHIVVTEKEWYSFDDERTVKAPRKSRKAEAPADIFTPEDIEMMNKTFALATLNA